MPAISIICPVYKAEKYLCKCVDSILHQSFGDFELLLIDDGSPDNSGQICDQYARQDCRVRVFHKQNGGVASARQLGLDNATGEYTIHVDPDDWVEPNMLEALYYKAKENDADVVICDFYINYRRYERYKKSGQIRETASQYLKDIICKYHGSLCNKLIRRSCFYHPKTLCFTPNQNLFEDLIMCTKVLTTPRKVVYLNKAFYHYMQVNPNSYTHAPKVYNDRKHLNEIMFGLLPLPEYKQEHNYLKKIEAYYALKENVFGKREFINKYMDLRSSITGWVYDGVVNRALAGMYSIEYIHINVKDFIKALIIKIF